MKVSSDEILARLRRLDDLELARRVENGDLTDVADSLAREELRRRGIESAAMSPVTDPEPAIDEGDSQVDESAEHQGDGDVDDEEPGPLILISAHNTPTEAYILQNNLQAEGVRAVVVGAHLGQAHSFFSAGTGGVRVLVPESQLLFARQVLRNIEKGEYASGAHEEPEGGLACPQCSGGSVREFSRGRLAAIFFMQKAGRHWRCADCGCEWKA